MSGESDYRRHTLDIRELLRPAAFLHSVNTIELRETHISWIVLTGSWAYKIKKPVKLDFIDASTLPRRHHFCQEELRLNRRLAPQLYLDVVPITRSEGRAIVGGSGTAIEYAVLMQQFSESDELPALLARGDVDTAQIAALGALLAQFHSNAAVADPTCAPERTRQMCELVLVNLAHVLAHAASLDAAACADADRLANRTHDGLRVLRRTFELREQRGFVRECHGDLHAANIVRSQGRLVPFDCIEFAPELRWIDIIDDVSFLVMDLASRERPDLAFTLLSRYLETAGDYEGVRVLPFYAVYRALVRAKIDALKAGQTPAQAGELGNRFRQRIAAATGWTELQRPKLVLMHGVSGSGKSWLSERLVPEMRAVRVRSDLERKRLAAMEVTQPAGARVHEGIYSPQFTRRTYERLADCARICLRAGLSVIVDASFLRRTDRAQFRRLAARVGAPCVIVSCRADPDTLSARVLQRSTERNDASDATLSVLHAQLREDQPFDAAEQQCAVSIDTTEPEAARHAANQIETVSRRPA